MTSLQKTAAINELAKRFQESASAIQASVESTQALAVQRLLSLEQMLVEIGDHTALTPEEKQSYRSDILAVIDELDAKALQVSTIVHTESLRLHNTYGQQQQ